jgi:hypothetical protein
MKKNIYTLILLTGYLVHAQPINPASTTEFIMPVGSYRKLANKGAGIPGKSYWGRRVNELP